MTQCGWWRIIVAALGTGLLPGCNPFALTNLSSKSDEHAKLQRVADDREANKFPPQGLANKDLPPPPVIDVEYANVTPPIPPPVPTEPAEIRHPNASPPVPAVPVNTKVDATPRPDPEVVQALRRLVDHQPDKAKEVLARYTSPNREILCALLNIAGRVHEKGLDGLDAQEICTIQESMRALSLSFLTRAPLSIGRMFFFESGRNGEVRPLRAGHVFRAGFHDRPGELVQIHVEFHNLACKKGDNNLFETNLLCTAEISDSNDKGGTPLRKIELTDGAVAKLSSPVPRTEYDTNFAFYMPDLPAGNLVLTLTLHDLTRPDQPRVARRSLEFCVNNQGERAQLGH